MSEPRAPNPAGRKCGEDPAAARTSGWQMPGGEDLLNFALSAGLASGSWWLELQGRRPEESAESRKGAAPAATGERK